MSKKTSVLQWYHMRHTQQKYHKASFLNSKTEKSVSQKSSFPTDTRRLLQRCYFQWWKLVSFLTFWFWIFFLLANGLNADLLKKLWVEAPLSSDILWSVTLVTNCALMRLVLKHLHQMNNNVIDGCSTVLLWALSIPAIVADVENF